MHVQDAKSIFYYLLEVLLQKYDWRLSVQKVVGV